MLSIFSPEMNPGSSVAADGRCAQRRHAPPHTMMLLLVLVLSIAAQCLGMQAQEARDGTGTADLALGNSGGAGIDARMEARRVAALNQQRQKQMISDAEKLVKLAQELNNDADAGGTILSPAERLQKAAEIEKLAKNVKDRMTYAIEPPDESPGPFAAWQR